MFKGIRKPIKPTFVGSKAINDGIVSLIYLLKDIVLTNTREMYAPCAIQIKNLFADILRMIHCLDHVSELNMPENLIEDFLPTLISYAKEDAAFCMEKDPAAESLPEVILAYPGFEAVLTYRVANFLISKNVRLVPRLICEAARSRTGIDIHPAAKIGRKFFIDHGSGVVIGSTSVVGDRVTLYKGVILGASRVPSRKENEFAGNQKRHPTLENDVTIYSNTMIIGGKTTVGCGAIVGANLCIRNSVPPHSITLK